MGIAHRRLDGDRVAQIGLDRVNLADFARWLQKKREIGPPCRYANAPARLGQSTHDMAADEA